MPLERKPPAEPQDYGSENGRFQIFTRLLEGRPSNRANRNGTGRGASGTLSVGCNFTADSQHHQRGVPRRRSPPSSILLIFLLNLDRRSHLPPAFTLSRQFYRIKE